ncbi:MAG: TRAM domain-containing protein, partial [Ruminiclostridium sp.]|nr:TRAM domain-containing protein [Ruminiclostridium sp.]
NDYNLNKVASIAGIHILNINDLSNALKPLAVSGEEMTVKIIREGKESGQGVGYLDDGTMVVVEGAQKFKGTEVDVVVTSVLQTSAGRMVFARHKSSGLSVVR